MTLLRLRRAAFALVALVACRPRPTQIKLNMNADVRPERAQTLSITALRGARTIDELSRAQGSITRLRNDSRAIFPGSVTFVPTQGAPRDELVSVLAVLDVAAGAGQPAVHIERVQRLRFLEHTPQEGYLYFNTECATPSAGCTTTAVASECTVARRCLERGLTCGDDGVCVGLDLPLVIVPPDAPLDGGVIDERAPRDAATPDAQPAAPPRLIAPMSTSTVSSRRPTLRWIATSATATSDVRVCRDRALSVDCVTLRAQAGVALARPTSELAPGVWFWNVRSTDASGPLAPSATWQFRVGFRSADNDRDTRWSADADFNGDGLGDAVVGAPGTLRVLVTPGSRVTFVTATPTTIDGASAGGRFGASVASAGDLDGDGFAELVVGAPDAALAHVYRGSAEGLRVSAPTVLRGSPSSNFGQSVAGAGDVNGDGYGDLLVGAYLASPVAGRGDTGEMRIYLGSASGVSQERSIALRGALGGDWFGFSVASAGDVNGDGLSDVIVGAYGADVNGRVNAGSASVYHGASNGISATPARVIVGGAAAEELGWSVASAGDVNGDGFSDVIVGSPWADPSFPDSGRAELFYGGAAGVSVNPALTLTGSAANDLYGWSVASLGDFNGDGFDDVAIGAKGATPMTASAAGITVLRMGGAGARQYVLNGRSARGEFGHAVAGAGDLNGDGLCDLIVGARAELVAGRAAGTASVVLGAMTTLAPAPYRVFAGEGELEMFGFSVASRGTRSARWR